MGAVKGGLMGVVGERAGGEVTESSERLRERFWWYGCCHWVW